MTRPRLLDLYCGAGGAAMGYHRAGFEVIGVDIEPQPNYPFEFHQADALTFPLDGFDAIHASPPCQRYSMMLQCRPGLAEKYPDLIPPTRERLQQIDAPWVLENVPGAPMRPDLVLCGCQFGLRSKAGLVLRRRFFEFWRPQFQLAAPCFHPEPSIPLAGHNPGRWYYKRHGHGVSADDRRQAMGIDWMNRDELAEAIPPAYTRFIGDELLQELAARGTKAPDEIRVPSDSTDSSGEHHPR